MRLIDANKLMLSLADWKLQETPIRTYEKPKEFTADDMQTMIWRTIRDCESAVEEQPTVKAIPVEQLLSILPKYDDYIHMKTYLYNETMEDIYSEGHEDGWNACLKAIKEELDYWEKENGKDN